MHIAYRAETLIDAHLVKDALERAEIPAFVTGEYLTGGVGQLPAMDYVAVMVPEAAREAADHVVAEVERALAESRVASAGWDADPDLSGPLIA
jgi:ethanolamine utilization protein EutA (predicted chaperonin)